MRFTRNVTPKPKMYDKRYKFKFAFFPQVVDKTKTTNTLLWLEPYLEVQQYLRFESFDGCEYVLFWEPIERYPKEHPKYQALLPRKSEGYIYED